MDKKKLVYILITLLLIVWGLVFMRIFKFFKNGNIEHVSRPLPSMPVEKEVKKDTFSLVANYPDPFLGNLTRNRIKKSFTDITPANVKEKKIISGVSKANKPYEKVAWPPVSFGGIIQKTKDGNTIGLMQVNRKDYLVRENEIYDGIKVIQVYPDSLKVEYKEEIKMVNR